MSLNNLRGELVKNKLKQADVAAFLGMTASNFNRKLAESVPFTVDEIKAVRARFFPNVDLGYLCESDGDVPTEREKELASLDALEGILDDVEADPVLYESLETMRSEVLSGKGEVS